MRHYITSLESLHLAQSLLPVLPAKGRDCFSHPSAGPFPPHPSSKKGFSVTGTPSGDGAGSDKLSTALLGIKTKQNMPREKEKWANWRADASPCIQHGSFAPLHLLLWVSQQSIPDSAPAASHWYLCKTLLSQPGQHHCCGSLCVVPV